jgi:hypothetical protein
MSCGTPANTPKLAVRFDACEIFHKVVALPEMKTDNDQPPHFHRLMQTAQPLSRSTSLD